MSGMSDPSKVIGFLDIAGLWDPSLALVMAGAISIGIFGFSLASRRKKTYLGESIQLPANTNIDRKLVFGGLTFGVGWGLAGYCPGPALVAIGTGNDKAIIFVVAMLAGMAMHELHMRLSRFS